MDDLYEMIENKNEDAENEDAEYLLLQLKEGSRFLEEQKEVLSQIWDGFHGRIVTFFETQKTNQVKKVRTYLYTCSVHPKNVNIPAFEVVIAATAALRAPY